MSELKFKNNNLHIINTTHIKIDEISSLILWFEELDVEIKYKIMKNN